MKTTPDTRLLRLPQVVELTGLRRSTIYKRISEGSFPRPYSLGGRAVAWKDSDIKAWQDSLVVAGPGQHARSNDNLQEVAQ